MRFLIVDDSPVDSHALATLLMSLGHVVDRSENPNEALVEVENNTYDLVFLDVVMPELDGYKFLRAVRMNPKTTGQYIVIYSSKKTPLEVDYGVKRAGANDYLTKPVTREQLEKMLSRIPA
jgi:two-component system chemotaxis response regulator CheY